MRRAVMDCFGWLFIEASQLCYSVCDYFEWPDSHFAVRASDKLYDAGNYLYSKGPQ